MKRPERFGLDSENLLGDLAQHYLAVVGHTEESEPEVHARWHSRQPLWGSSERQRG